MRRTLLALALLAVPANWRESVRQDLEEECVGGVPLGVACWQALAIGMTLRRNRNGARPRGVLRASRGDLVHALRAFRREPAAHAAVILTLAIGIGAAAAAHAVFNFALFRPTPGVHGEASIVSVQINYTTQRDGEPMRIIEGAPPSHLRAMRAASTGLTALAGAGRGDLPVSSAPGAPPQSMPVWWVTRDYFQVLGVRARLGNVFIGDDYDAPGSAVAVISEVLWQREFGRRADIVGQPLIVNGDTFTIRGVAEAFRGPDKLGQVDLWLPSSAKHAFVKDAVDDRWPIPTSLFGRLRPGATRDAVQEQLQAAWKSQGGPRPGYAPVLPHVYEGLNNGDNSRADRLLAIYRVVMSGVAVLLLLACANAANLLLARHARRGRELAVRAAIGASQFRLIRMMLIEAGLIAACSASVGVLIGAGILQAFRSLRIVSFLPVLENLAIDWRVAVFALVTSVATLVVSSVMPALIASRPNPVASLQLYSAPITPRAIRLRVGLVVVQLAASLVLLTGAGVLVQTVANLRAVDLGLDATSTKLFFLPRDGGSTDAARRGQLLERTVAALRETPGIERIALSRSTPLQFTTRMTVTPTGGKRGFQVFGQQASAEYFDLLRIPLLAGRVLTDDDASASRAPAVVPVVVNARFVDIVLQGTAALGRTFVERAGRVPVTYEVVGVVANTRTRNVRGIDLPAVYEPFDLDSGSRAILLRTALPTDQVTSIVRKVVATVDPSVAVNPVIVLADQTEQWISEERLMARLSSIVAGMSVLLACTGLYAVVASFVGERTREFGIRIALGAPRQRIATTILRRAAVLCLIGSVAGVLAAAWLGQFIAARLFGVSAIDGPTLAGAVVVLSATTLVAAWLPARRATRIDPAVTLRA